MIIIKFERELAGIGLDRIEKGSFFTGALPSDQDTDLYYKSSDSILYLVDRGGIHRIYNIPEDTIISKYTPVRELEIKVRR